MPRRVNKSGDIRRGDYYEDCKYHPCICIKDGSRFVSPWIKNHIEGISLIDGSISSCNIVHCGLRKLNLNEVIRWKKKWPNIPKK